MACETRTHELAMELMDKMESMDRTLKHEVVPYLTVLVWNSEQVLPKDAEARLRRALSDAIVERATMLTKIREILRDQSQLSAMG